jgi:hypothetical protein
MSKVPTLLIVSVCFFTYFVTATASTDAKIESDHPYTINFDPIYIPDAKSISLYFEKLELSHGDKLLLLNKYEHVLKTYTHSQKAFRTEQFPGDTIKIRLKTDSCRTDSEYEIIEPYPEFEDNEETDYKINELYSEFEDNEETGYKIKEPYPELEDNEEKWCSEKNTALPKKPNGLKVCPSKKRENANELKDKCPSKVRNNVNGPCETKEKPAFTETPEETTTTQRIPLEVWTSTDEDKQTGNLASSEKQETSKEQDSLIYQTDDSGIPHRSELKSATPKSNTLRQTEQPAQTDQMPIELHPYTQKTRVAVGEDNEYEISAYSTLPETVRVDIIVNPPSGVSVTSTKFVNYGAGMYIATCTLGTGDKYPMKLRLRANEPNEDFNVEAHAVYYLNNSTKGIKEPSVKIPFSAYRTDQKTELESDQKTEPESQSSQSLYTFTKIIYQVLHDLENQLYSYYYWHFA